MCSGRDRRPRRAAAPTGSGQAARTQLAEAKLGRSLSASWLAEFEHERAQAFRRELKPVPGAADTVQRVIAAGIKVCVASQGKLAKTQLTLGLTGLLDLSRPEALFSAESVALPKPDPALFQHAAAAMNATRSACAVIEDTTSGATAAVTAGMRAIGYAADSDEHALKNVGAEIIHSLHQLPQLLDIP